MYFTQGLYLFLLDKTASMEVPKVFRNCLRRIPFLLRGKFELVVILPALGGGLKRAASPS
jgi:hypothetical protein